MRYYNFENFGNLRIKRAVNYLRKAISAFLFLFAVVDANLLGFVNLTQSFTVKFQFCLSKIQENTSKSKCQYDKAIRKQYQEFKIASKNLFDGNIENQKHYCCIFLLTFNAFTANKILLVASILKSVFTEDVILCKKQQKK